MICFTVRQNITWGILEVCYTLGHISTEKVWWFSPSMVVVYILGIQNWFSLRPWGVDTQGEPSTGYLQVDSFVFPLSVLTSWKSAWSLLGSAVVQRRTGFCSAKEPQNWCLCPKGHSCSSDKGGGCTWTGEGALTWLPKLTNILAGGVDTKARSKLECSLLH